MTPLSQIVWAVYCVAALAYTVYSGTTGSGLDGYLMRLELNLLGVAEEVVTAVLTFGLLLAPLWAITRVVGWISPSLVWASTNPPGRSETGLSKPGIIERMNRPVQSVSWKAVLFVTAIPILVGVVVFPVIYRSAQRDRQEKVYPIDLTSGIAGPPPGARFVGVAGLMQQSYVLLFKHTFNSVTVSHELFAPVTGNRWTSADPVRYFVRAVQYEDSQGKVLWPGNFRKSGVAHFSGEIGRRLPAFVESEYRSQGLKIAPFYSMVEWNGLPDHQGSSPFVQAGLVSGFCLLIAVFPCFMMMLAKSMVARIQKQRSVQSAR